MKCEAVLGYPCREQVVWSAHYDTSCPCWPKTKTFCDSDGRVVESQWQPPWDKGLCGLCYSPITFTGLEEIPEGSTRAQV